MKLSKDKTKDKLTTAKKGPFGLELSFGKKTPKGQETVNPETFVFTPTLPKVNAIPSALVEKYEIKGVVRKFVFAGIALAAVFGLAWAGGTYYVGTLEAQLETIKAEEGQLASQVETLLPYEEYKNAVAAKRTALSDEVSKDVNMGTIYGDLYTTANVNQIQLSNLSIAQSADEDTASSACANPEPFSESTNLIGCITISGTGPTADGGRTFINQLVSLGGDKPRYANPFISSVAITDEGSSFEASVFFTSELYSGQYSSLAESLDDLLAKDSGTDASTEVQTGENNQPSYSSAVTLEAQQLVPELTEEDLLSIDSTAVNACSTGDTATAIEDIGNILATRLPADNNNLETYTDQLTTTLTTECQGA